MAKINLAISTCPNDTFAFHAILENIYLVLSSTFACWTSNN